MAGLPFLWLGMVAAISLLEAPLTFHAEGVSRTAALAVGELVFPALNGVEVTLALVVLVPLWPQRHDAVRAWRLSLTATAVLAAQVSAVRSMLHASTVEVLVGRQTAGRPGIWSTSRWRARISSRSSHSATKQPARRPAR